MSPPRSKPFSNTAASSASHGQDRSRAHARMLFDFSTTSAAAHHTAASVRRLPSGAMRVRSSFRERAHGRHS